MVGMIDIDIRVSSRLKEELAWATDKWLWVISTILMFNKTIIVLKNKAVLSLKQYCLCC